MIRRGLGVALVIAAVSAMLVSVAFAATKPPVPPVVNQISPTNGPPGTIVSVYGSGFGAKSRNSIVWFNGVKVPDLSWSDTTITFSVPTRVGAGYVGIQADAGMSNGKYFIPFAAPTLSSLSALEQEVGLDITVTGTGFETSQGVGWVSFNGTPGSVKSWSDTAIVVTVPAGSTPGYVGVVQHDLSTNGIYFTPYTQGHVTATSAGYALVGDIITVTGTSFGTTPGKVVLGGVQFDATTWSDTQITFAVPAFAASGYLGAIPSGGRTSNGIWLTVAPRVTSLSTWWAAPGSRVTVSGSGFGASPGSPYVLLLGGREIPATNWSDTSIDFVVPADGVSGYVGLTTADRMSTSNAVWLLVESPATISAVTPADPSPGATITVTGTGFGSAGPTSELRLDASPLAVVSWTDTEIVAYAPAVASYGYVGVWKNGIASNGVLLNVAAPPVLVAPLSLGLSSYQMQVSYGPIHGSPGNRDRMGYSPAPVVGLRTPRTVKR